MLDLLYGIIQYSYIASFVYLSLFKTINILGTCTYKSKQDLGVGQVHSSEFSATPLIPDPMSRQSGREHRRHWIWDQSLLTVEINTITRVLRQDICMSCNGRRHDYPRSIVTDQFKKIPICQGYGSKLSSLGPSFLGWAHPYNFKPNIYHHPQPPSKCIGFSEICQ